MSRLIPRDDAGQLWDIVVEAGRDAAGKRRRHQERFHGGIRAATRRVNELQAKYEGLTKAPEKLTVAGAYDAWRRIRFPQLAPKTAERYEEMMRLDVLPYIGDVLCARLTPARLAELWLELATSGKKPPHNRTAEDAAPEGLAPQTVWHVYTALRSLWKWLLDLEMVTNDPTRPKSARPPRPPKPQASHVKAAPLGYALSVVEQARGTEGHTAVFLCLTAGLRDGEACGLTWSMVDLENGTAFVLEAASGLKGGRVVFKDPKTAGSVREVDLLEMTVAELVQVKAWQDRQRLHCGPGWNERDLVCVKPDGSPINPQNLSSNWKRWRKRRGIELTLHGMRHTWATFLASAIDIEHARDELGHGDIRTTGRYVHTLDERRELVRTMKEAAVAAAVARFEEESGRQRADTVPISAAKGHRKT